jgi:hypothetical protein
MFWLWVWLVSATVLASLGLAYFIGTRPWRALPDGVCDEIAQLPTHRPNQHVVDLELKDGRVVRKVSVGYGRFPALVNGRTITHRYRPRDVLHAHPHVRKDAA